MKIRTVGWMSLLAGVSLLIAQGFLTQSNPHPHNPPQIMLKNYVPSAKASSSSLYCMCLKWARLQIGYGPIAAYASGVPIVSHNPRLPSLILFYPNHAGKLTGWDNENYYYTDVNGSWNCDPPTKRSIDRNDAEVKGFYWE